MNIRIHIVYVQSRRHSVTQHKMSAGCDLFELSTDSKVLKMPPELTAGGK